VCACLLTFVCQKREKVFEMPSLQEHGACEEYCPKVKDKNDDPAKEGACTHVDVVLAMDEGVEVVTDRKHSKYCGVCRVQAATKVACPPNEAPLMDLMKYPYMSPIGYESKYEDSLADAKTVVPKKGKDKSNHYCVAYMITGHTQDCCTYRRIPLKKKERYMIGITPKDGDDTVEEFEDDMKVTQTGVGVETPRMDLENESECPWSIQSPEAKRLKIREEMRQEGLNEKMDKFFNKHGLLDFDKVKLSGIKPRMASQERTAGRDPTMEV
jgi:hypothetical protein